MTTATKGLGRALDRDVRFVMLLADRCHWLVAQIFGG